MVSEGIFINGEKVTFNPENILNGDVSAYTEAIGEATQDWLDEHLEPGGSVPIDDTLTIAGAAADAKKTGVEISELKEEITDKSDTADMLKAFPTDTASGSVASFADGANVPVKSLIVNIDPVQEGSGDPSPDNVRPISGWSEVNVETSGKNLLALPVVKFNEAEATKSNCFFVKAGTYILQYSCDAEHRYGIRLLDMAGNVISDNAYKPNASAPYNSSAQAYYAGINIPSGFKTVVCNIVEDCYVRIVSNQTGGGFTNVQFEEGSTATSYEPYNGQSINIDWATEAGTVYGGKLDVTNGVLTVTHLIATLGDFDWSYVADWNGYPCFYTDSVSGGAGDLNNINTLSSSYKAVSFSDLYNALRASTSIVAFNNLNRFYVRDSRYSDVSSFKTAMSTTQLMYPIATPLTITLDSHEIDALYGSNNVWADSGNSEVVYRADPTLYIGRLTEPDADMVADANIVSGQYFMVGNTLYKATANIASGATISPNVNCTRKSLSEALNEINA